MEWLKDQEDIITIYNDINLGFPKGCNQGIEISSGDNIMLLNNDVIVTPNWLNNLKKALYSNEKVGAVSNNCPYYQTVPSKYNNLDELFMFASKFNNSNEEIWESRVKLIGFCMLIKREVVDKIGLLDESFSPGNYEDDDYSYRMIEAGYTLLLCKDTFVHHFGHLSFKDNQQQYLELLKKNEKKFEEKWGFNSQYSSYIRNEIINLINEDKNASLNILEVGCGCGGTLLKLKNNFINANLYGIEINEYSAKISGSFADVKVEDIEKATLTFNKKMFDYIIFSDVLEQLLNPWQVLEKIKAYLKDEGYILATISNVMHYTVIRELINGNWSYHDSGILDKTHVRFFTLNEIIKMFKESGYVGLEYSTTNTIASEQDNEFLESLYKMSSGNDKFQFLTYQYIIKAGIS